MLCKLDPDHQNPLDTAIPEQDERRRVFLGSLGLELLMWIGLPAT